VNRRGPEAADALGYMGNRLVRVGLWGGVLGVVLVSSAAEAQQTRAVDLPKFNPSFAGDRFFGVPSPFTASDGIFNLHAGVLLDYAHDPLVVSSKDGSPLSCGEDECSIVEHQMLLHLNATGVLFDRVAINIDMPFALVQSGEGVVGGDGLSFTSPNGAAVGDLRLGARVRLYGEYHEPFQIGLGGYVWLPTATGAAYLSDGSVRGQPHLLVGGRADRFIWTTMAGPTLRNSTTIGNVTLGHQFNWGAGLGVLLLEERNLQLGIETTGAVSLDEIELRNTNAEAQAGLKYRFVRVLEMGAAVGPGFTNGIGTPDARAVFSFQYTPEPAARRDADGDGIFDEVDACPKEPGVANEDPTKNGCPPPKDRDGDGVLDAVDACIDVPGKPSADPKLNGCPPVKLVAAPPPADRDGDGIADDVDACPDVVGVANKDPAQNGCPPDTDGDGILDDVDACPTVKGPANADPKKHGCPRVRLTETEIVILEQVQFDTNKATIKPVSDSLLDSVAEVMKEHPEILKIEVQGHTDIRGAYQWNVQLSNARSKSVADALAKRGIDRKRMSSKGYGPDKPLDPANNEEAWQQNRRVQFLVLEKTPSSTPAVTK